MIKTADLKRYLMKFDRLCAWSLIAVMGVFFISGYGMTKGIISPQLSKYLHETLLPIPSGIAFAFHSAYGMHIAMKRWKAWNPFIKAVLIIYGVALVVGIIIFQFVVLTPGATQTPTSLDL